MSVRAGNKDADENVWCVAGSRPGWLLLTAAISWNLVLI